MAGVTGWQPELRSKGQQRLVMKDSRLELLHPTQRSPCLSCSDRGKDKELCAPTCGRILNYQKATALLEEMGDHRAELVMLPFLDHGAILVAPYPAVPNLERKPLITTRSTRGRKRMKARGPKADWPVVKSKATLEFPLNERNRPILEAVKKLADDEMRSMSAQVPYMLNWCLEEKYGTGGFSVGS
jgi:hypothetical protein